MKRKFICILLTLCLTLSLTACGDSNSVPETPESTETAESSESEETDSLDEIESISQIETEENLFSVEIKIPADFVESSTQEELDAIAKEKGYKSIALHEDGSATYTMTKAQHKELMSELSDKINSTLAEMINSENYTNITDITANDDFTKFTVTTTSTELSLAESLSVLAFYTYGGMYNIFNTTPADNVQVEFVNAESGEVINTANSSDMGE